MPSRLPPGLRIALLAPLISPIREPQIGGVATFITDLAAGLGQAGHEVDLYAASGSAVEGLRIVDTGVESEDLADTLFRPLGPRPPSARLRRGRSASRRAFATAYGMIANGGYDLIHNHAFDAPAIELAGELDPPVVHTLHLPPDPSVAEALTAARAGPRPPLIAAVSPSQRRAWEEQVTVDLLLRAGVPTARIPWSPSPGEDLLVAGRLSPEKGVLEAVEIARGSGRRLVIAGSRYDAAYANRVARVAGRNGDVRIEGALTRPQLWERMAGAAALIFPIRWEEPFGLVTAEAQAAGCPVIGYRRGALEDVVDDGITGAVLEPGDVEGARRALATLHRYDRRACRLRAEQLLDIAPTIEAHLRLYARLLGRS